MDLTQVANSIEEQGKAFDAFKKANDTRLAEIEKKGSADPLLTAQLEKINAFFDKTADAKQEVLTQSAIKERLDQIETAVSRTMKGTGTAEEKETKPEVIEYCKAFRGFIQSGMGEGDALKALGQKAMSVISDPDGGYLVTPQMSATIIKKVFESSPVRALAAVETISSDSLDLIDDHDEASYGWAAETGTISETTSPQIAKRNIPTHIMYAEPRATQKLLDDAGINIEQWLAEKQADKFGRVEATAFVSGTGVTQPRGFLTYAAGTTWGTIEQVNSGSSGALTADGLISLFYSLKSDYAQNAAFLANRASVGAIRLLKEATTNQYIWQPGLQNGQPDRLLGVPIYMASDMPVAAANSLSVALADWRRAYQIVDRIGIRVLRDPYTAKPYVKFYTTKRVGGDVANFEAIKLQKLA